MSHNIKGKLHYQIYRWENEYNANKCRKDTFYPPKTGHQKSLFTFITVFLYPDHLYQIKWNLCGCQTKAQLKKCALIKTKGFKKKTHRLKFCKFFPFVQICCALCSDTNWFNISVLQVAQLSLFILGLIIFFKQNRSLGSVNKWPRCSSVGWLALIPLSLSLCLSVCVLAETVEIQELLSHHGVSVQTMSEVLPIRVLPARILSQVYVKLGKSFFLPYCLRVCSSQSSNPCAPQETAKSWI